MHGVRREAEARLQFGKGQTKQLCCPLCCGFRVFMQLVLQIPFQKPLLVTAASLHQQEDNLLHTEPNQQPTKETLSLPLTKIIVSKACLSYKNVVWMLILQHTEIKEDQESLLRDKVFLWIESCREDKKQSTGWSGETFSYQTAPCLLCLGSSSVVLLPPYWLMIWRGFEQWGRNMYTIRIQYMYIYFMCSIHNVFQVNKKSTQLNSRECTFISCQGRVTTSALRLVTT